METKRQIEVLINIIKNQICETKNKSIDGDLTQNNLNKRLLEIEKLTEDLEKLL